jgi:hypothetical protein
MSNTNPTISCQLPLLAPLTSLDKTGVGLGNVDSTSDVNKPVSTAQQSALNLKANIATPTFTGTSTFQGDVIVAGNNIGTQIGNALARTEYIMSDASNANTMMQLNKSTNEILVYSNIVPAEGSTYSLGSVSQPFKTLYNP